MAQQLLRARLLRGFVGDVQHEDKVLGSLDEMLATVRDHGLLAQVGRHWTMVRDLMMMMMINDYHW